MPLLIPPENGVCCVRMAGAAEYWASAWEIQRHLHRVCRSGVTASVPDAQKPPVVEKRQERHGEDDEHRIADAFAARPPFVAPGPRYEWATRRCRDAGERQREQQH